MRATMKRQRKRTLPTLVWWQWDQSIGGHIPRRPPRPGILLEWREVETPGRPKRWDGLVLWAESKGGLLRWSIHLDWARSHELNPVPEPQSSERDFYAR
ncbi:hypothetical protein J2S40_001142 [Nocardioides luteus]|uniref:Transposase n=1 Tax=Nocardioides luteus TaxID=1844 RepID=A0ABQ5SU46_9ACTN|nr:hypothetical protein [Nocardioides luteus]GLJ67007.1 hypothetical protein GCM10017579_10430 [Nocardioides luteus]